MAAAYVCTFDSVNSVDTFQGGSCVVGRGHETIPPSFNTQNFSHKGDDYAFRCNSNGGRDFD